MQLGKDLQLRDVYSPRTVKKLALAIAAVRPEFPAAELQKRFRRSWQPLGFAERSRLIVDLLTDLLPMDFPAACDTILASLGPALQLEPGKTDWDAFIHVPLTEYIARHGCSARHFKRSMQALAELTKRFSSEGAVRPFIENFPAKSLVILEQWTRSPDVHVRRLASEGSRPRLPLAKPLHQFKTDPAPVLKLLEKLKDDPELYVRRSVANNLGDISKDHPDMVTNLAECWLSEAKLLPPAQKKQREWLVRHALRYLLKHGSREALRVSGYSAPELDRYTLQLASDSIAASADLHWTFEFESTREQPLVIYYALRYCNAAGKQRAARQFYLSERRAAAGEQLRYTKKLSFKDLSTRKHYPGLHTLALIVNGQQIISADFMLAAE
ncbi:MAG: DNA alkylation repair protein [Leptospiraceae bacterium]|nr:DNA alkylation repair protein [Leptospiraceae bacterium]